MRSEQIRVGDKTLRADEVEIPDIRYVGILVSQPEQEVVEYAYRSAIRVHTLILGRERNQNAVKKRFEIEIPDLGFIAKTLRRHEREKVAGFQVVFQALVNHLLPKAVVERYTFNGRNVAGVRYRGMGWVSPLP